MDPQAATISSETVAPAQAMAAIAYQPEFASLVSEHQAMVYSIALHTLRNRESAEEVAQDVFLQMFRHLGKFESPNHVTAWLRRVTCHRAIDTLRGRRDDRQTSLSELPEPAAAETLDDPLLRTTLRKLVDTLPEKARMVMILRYQEDLDPDEIAHSLEMPLGTVKSHLQRSLATLREKLGRVLGEPVVGEKGL